MSDVTGQTNVQAESAATLTPAEAQMLEAYRARDYGTIGALLGSMATLGEGEALQPVEPRAGYLDSIWAQSVHPDDIEAAELPLDVMTAQVFAALISSSYVDQKRMYGGDECTSEILHTIRRGIIQGIRESAVFELITLKKLYPHVATDEPTIPAELTPEERAAKVQAIGEFYDELTEDEARAFWREVKRARPDLYQAMLDKYVTDLQSDQQ